MTTSVRTLLVTMIVLGALAIGYAMVRALDPPEREPIPVIDLDALPRPGDPPATTQPDDGAIVVPPVILEPLPTSPEPTPAPTSLPTAEPSPTSAPTAPPPPAPPPPPGDDDADDGRDPVDDPVDDPDDDSVVGAGAGAGAGRREDD